MNTRIQTLHHLVDYGIGILLLIGPWLFGFAESWTATVVTIAFGVAILANSVATADRRLPKPLAFPLHLLLEIAGGGLLIGAPWILGFSHHAWVPHVVIGTVVAMRALLLAAGVAATRILADESGSRETHG
jgi:hypothetical protein